MTNSNYALVVNDLHGVAERETAFFRVVQTCGGQIDHIILNGDVFGGQHVGRLQKLFYDIKNYLKGDASMISNGNGKAIVLLGNLRLALKDLTDNYAIFRDDSLKDVVVESYHYGVFLSWACNNSPVLRKVFEQDILDGIEVFFKRLNEIRPKNCVVILNTGNWEEATPLDFDPTELAIEKRVPYDQRLSRKIAEKCKEYKIVFNEDYMRINRTGIVGARAIIDAAKNDIAFDIYADQMIAHYPNEYECFPEHNPSEKDKFCRDGVIAWLHGLHAYKFYHGHIHSEGCQDHDSSWTAGHTTSNIYAHKVGLKSYALVQL